ncbi:pentachlorophenol monooxygenase/3-(3-hydroxy-phenyl)propionate hydroxylase [Lentzea xinjiangensis]|uniref:Pentachlorophenol monooxygenase/3-(3-hydroxy-phenyl)propionate hydroxylase n=1 Tax=Lentzea xinjiangensis TaxID=402600 RepID=A0A1H9BM96_9PSEU|nr:FAD-dependent monooxygenase [Lentzea xinjiangensis]SEP90134.1 pentachlorophenol monooxygenase/3-(3-hydroxy-phenyl)propionate hydroxylase [Lentzea xinjiangensis]
MTVLVVGAGPVGLASALLLARAGVPSTVLEKAERRARAGSRSICVQRDVLEVLERVGVGQAVADAGVTWYTGRTFHRDREVLTLTFPRTGGFPPFVNTPQTVVEHLLSERVRAEPLIELRYGHALTGLTLDDEGVSTQDGIRATHCIAADGAHSTARQLLGIPFEGLSFDDRFIIADVRVDLDLATPERRFYFDPPWNAGQEAARPRQVLLHPQPEGVWRIDLQVAEDVQLTDAHIRSIVGDRPYEVLWQSTYRFHQRRAATLRAGRVLLAGDAAHVMSPFGARGLNSGICDADNAAWKIAADRRGEAGPHLLASYDAERGAAADENLRITGETMRFLVPGTAAERAHRQRALDTGEGIDSGKLFTPFSYESSPLTTDGGELIAGSRTAGPGFSTRDGWLIRPDGHVAAHRCDDQVKRRALGW